MALIKCKECGNQVSNTAAVCPHCGAKVPRTSAFTKLVAAFIGLGMFGSIMSSINKNKPTENPEANIAVAAPAPPQAPPPVKSPTELLEEAKKLSTSVEKATLEELNLARDLLAKIPADAPESKEASKISKKIAPAIAKKEETLKSAQKKIQAALALATRQKIAETWETSLLDKGMSVDVTAEGKEKTTLKLKYVLVSKAFAHNLTKNGEFIQTLRNAGFKKLVMTDGYDDTWHLEL